MYNCSAAFNTAIVRSHTVATQVDVYMDGTLQGVAFDITDGNVTIQDDAIRRRCNIRMQDPVGALVPDDFTDIFTPGGAEFQLFRGILFPNGTKELIPLGVFGVSRYRLDDSGPTMSAQIDAFDRGRRVQRAALTQDYVIPKNTNYVTAIQQLVHSRYPSVLWGDVAPTTMITPLIVLQTGKDPWGEARRLLGNIGYEIFFDPWGLCTIQPVDVSTGNEADWTLTEGDGGSLLSLTKTMQDDSFFNHVVVTGENSSNTTQPFRGEAMDSNPNSPTNINGRMGDVVDFFTSSDITSQAQAQSTASARLAKSLGIPINVETQDLVHPGLDIDDRLHITRERAKIDEVYIVSKLTIPMTYARAMNVATRQRLLNV